MHSPVGCSPSSCSDRTADAAAATSPDPHRFRKGKRMTLMTRNDLDRDSDHLYFLLLPAAARSSDRNGRILVVVFLHRDRRRFAAVW